MTTYRIFACQSSETNEMVKQIKNGNNIMAKEV
jgi:hypothetical protein